MAQGRFGQVELDGRSGTAAVPRGSLKCAETVQ
jgi:hypothetical protein